MDTKRVLPQGNTHVCPVEKVPIVSREKLDSWQICGFVTFLSHLKTGLCSCKDKSSCVSDEQVSQG